MGLFDRLRSDEPRVVFLGIDGVPYDLVEEHPDVSECVVRPFETSSGTRLKAFIVPARDTTETENTLNQWLREQLPAPERPVRLDLGTELPRNEMGKLSDW